METRSDAPKAGGAFNGLWPVSIVVLVLSLATWLFFQTASMPLTPSETTLEVGGWFLVVFLGKMIWRRARQKKSPHS